MRSSLLSTVTVALAAVQLCAAQTFTSCDPTKKTCPADKALGKTITVDFTKGASSEFNLAQGTTLTYDGTNGAVFTMDKETEAPTITSNWYIFFGKVDVVLRAAPGIGIVSSFVMESDDLDEIDWEWLGGDTTQVETNYFGKGNTTTYDRATYVPVATPQDTFHTYTIDWNAQRVQWIIDGNVVRTLEYSAANGGSNYPQTPMQVKMGNWDGGSSTSPEGTVQWAGGHSDFSKGQTYSMYVRSITVQDYSTGGGQYVYSDMSGSWQSIKTEGSSSDSSPDSSSSSSSSTSSSSGSSSRTTSTTSKSTSSSSTFSSVTTAPVATGGLGLGAVPPNATVTSATVTAATTTGSAATTKATGNAGSALQVCSKFGMAILGLGLGYLVM